LAVVLAMSHPGTFHPASAAVGSYDGSFSTAPAEVAQVAGTAIGLAPDPASASGYGYDSSPFSYDDSNETVLTRDSRSTSSAIAGNRESAQRPGSVHELPGDRYATTTLGGLDDLAARWAAMGAEAAGPGVSPTLSRLDVGGMDPLYGMSFPRAWRPQL